MKLSITFMIELFYITIARANLNLTVPTLANVTAGQPFVIMWAGAASPITIDLVNAYNTKNATIVLTIGSECLAYPETISRKLSLTEPPSCPHRDIIHLERSSNSTRSRLHVST